MNRKRWIGLLLAFCVLLSSVPMAGIALTDGEAGTALPAAGENIESAEYLSVAAPAVSEKWDGQTTDTNWWSADGTEFHISDPAQLAGLAALVNDGHDFTGQTVYLDQDIDLGGQVWTPIGQITSIDNNAAVTGICFAGTFDGQGHEIVGLKISIGSDMGYGLFAFSKGTIRNVGVDETSVVDLSTLSLDLTAVGSIVGFNYGGLVSNCYTKATCTDAGNTLTKDPCIGGIAGMNDYNGIIEYCWNAGSITLTSLKARIGGIVGSSVYTRATQGVDSYIRYCYNQADITANACDNLGGIVGFSRRSHIIYCYNVGTLTCNTKPSGQPNTAGIVGVKNSYTGSQIAYCYNAGMVTNNGTSQSIIGAGSTPTADCYYLTGSASEANGATALDKEELIAAMLSLSASSDQISYVADTANRNNGFPVLSWQVTETTPQIVSVTDPAGISVAYGTEADALELPGTVSAALSDGTTRDLDVAWDTSGYDAITSGAHTLTGTLILTDDVENPEDLTVSIVVTVEAGPADYAAVDAALEKIALLAETDYTADSWAKLLEARDAVVRGLAASEQAKVDAYAAAIEDAITALVPVAVEMELAISTGMVTAAEVEGKYNITWNARILLGEETTVADINASGLKFKNYGVYYATSAAAMEAYKTASADELRQVVFAEGEDVDVYTAYGFRLKNVTENKVRASMFYIEYELDGQNYILLSSVDEVIAVIAA